MLKIGIIGGGACGLMCANRLLQENVDLEIDILEKDSKVGKKILVSGNGRCNLTNLNVSADAYNDQKFMTSFLERCSANDLINEFEDLGVLTQADEEGRVYPISESSNSVLDMLLIRLLDSHKVSIYTENPVKEIIKEENEYIVKTPLITKSYDVLVIASGSAIQEKQKVNNLNNVLEKMGIEFTSYAPSLTPLVVKDNLKDLKGLRVKANLSLNLNHQYYDSYGEVLFKDNAVSGIAAFELSSYIARARVQGVKINNCDLELDLLPGMYTPIDLLKSRKNTLQGLPAEYFLRGMFNKMLNKRIYQQAKVEVKDRFCDELSDDEIEEIGSAIKGLHFTVSALDNVEPAQVLAGGVELKEIKENFESQKYPNLYFGGEVLNIDGSCGGFNLHFAFASGLLIAEAILEKI